jgi:hypothetical protein
LTAVLRALQERPNDFDGAGRLPENGPGRTSQEDPLKRSTPLGTYEYKISFPVAGALCDDLPRTSQNDLNFRFPALLHYFFRSAFQLRARGILCSPEKNGHLAKRKRIENVKEKEPRSHGPRPTSRLLSDFCALRSRIQCNDNSHSFRLPANWSYFANCPDLPNV